MSHFFFSAFRLPDTIFEVLVFGTFASAFIPVFSKLVRKDKQEAWQVASIIVNIGVVTFSIFALLVGIFADPIYAFIAPGYDASQRFLIVQITRILLVAQIFFVASYVLTGILESMKRFLVPALAPIFYNIGIILGTIFLSDYVGMLAPAYGALFGAAIHFVVQLPLAIRLGFRFGSTITPDEHVKKIGRLAAPRILETSILQVSKMTELYLASLISTASYAYYYLGNSLQAVPVGLFGLSIAKASLPTLSEQADNPAEFKKTLGRIITQVTFLVVPFAAMLIVLRIPIVRLIYGRELFDWQSTVQTSLVVSSFGVGIIFQCISALLSRSFYARHNTRTPVIVSIITIFVITILDFLLIRGFGVGVWGLAVAYSIGVTIQSIALFIISQNQLGKFSTQYFVSFLKIIVSALVSGGAMYLLLKLLDRSVWVKNIPILGAIRFPQNLPFEVFVLDTRYTGNLLLLTAFVASIGLFVYVVTAFLLNVPELKYVIRQMRAFYEKGKSFMTTSHDTVPLEPTPNDPVH